MEKGNNNLSYLNYNFTIYWYLFKISASLSIISTLTLKQEVFNEKFTKIKSEFSLFCLSSKTFAIKISCITTNVTPHLDWYRYELAN